MVGRKLLVLFRHEIVDVNFCDTEETLDLPHELVVAYGLLLFAYHRYVFFDQYHGRAAEVLDLLVLFLEAGGLLEVGEQLPQCEHLAEGVHVAQHAQQVHLCKSGGPVALIGFPIKFKKAMGLADEYMLPTTRIHIKV